MSQYRWVLPQEVSSAALRQVLRGGWVCPWCSRARVSDRAGPGDDDLWIRTPARIKGPPYVCSGCAIDVYRASNSIDFDNDPDRPLVEAIAGAEGQEVDAFRRICLEHQLSIIGESMDASQRLVLRELADELLELLAALRR